MKKFAWSDKKHSEYLEKGILRHLHRARLAYINQQLNDSLAICRNPRCLDLGCGDGVFIKHFQSRGLKAFIGCDADYTRLLRAREYSDQKEIFINAFAETTPFRDHSFDLVLLHHVLEHSKDDKKVLSECSRILKPGGVLIIGVPNENSINGRILRRLHPKLYRAGEHLNFYSEQEILNLLRLFKFRMLQIKRVGFLFPVYYIHMLLISNRISFLVGNLLTRIFKFSADSLIFICRLE